MRRVSPQVQNCRPSPGTPHSFTNGSKWFKNFRVGMFPIHSSSTSTCQHQYVLVFFFFSFTSGFSPEVPSTRRGNSLFHFVELSDRPLRICLPIKRWFLSLAWEVCYQLTETFLSRPLSHTCSTLYKVYGPKYMCHAGNRLVGDSTADAFLLNCGWESARIAVSWTRDKQNWTTNERRPIASRLSGQSLVLNTLNFFHQLPKRR